MNEKQARQQVEATRDDFMNYIDQIIDEAFQAGTNMHNKKARRAKLQELKIYNGAQALSKAAELVRAVDVLNQAIKVQSQSDD